MTTKKDDGGQALAGYLTLRDWFAGQAMAAAAARCEYEPFKTATDLASYLYQIADAMIEERAK